MKCLVSYAFLFLILISCASKKNESLRIQEKIASEQVRTLKEIQQHSEMILHAHPELSPDAKLKVKQYMDETLTKQQELKDEESKIVQILLSKSLRVNQLSNDELRDKKSLQKRLQAVYESKAENILSLVSHIIEMSERNEVDAKFERDMELFMRNLR